MHVEPLLWRLLRTLFCTQRGFMLSQAWRNAMPVRVVTPQQCLRRVHLRGSRDISRDSYVPVQPDARGSKDFPTVPLQQSIITHASATTPLCIHWADTRA